MADSGKKIHPILKVKSTESAQSMVIAGPSTRQDLSANSSNSGIESSASQAIGFIEGTDLVTDVYNCASVILSCPKHESYAMSEVRSKAKKAKGLTMPTIYVSPKMGFRSGINSKLKSLLANEKSETGYISFDAPLPLQNVRIQLPLSKKFVSRLIFRSGISKDSSLCCKDVGNKNVRWFTVSQLLENAHDFWGPDALMLINVISDPQHQPQYLNEMKLKTLVPYLPREVPTHENDLFLKLVGYSERDVHRLLAEYLQHSYPERFMSRTALTAYLKACQWMRKDKPMDPSAVFRAFSTEGLPYLHFYEFLIGIAASEPDLNHEGVAATIRDRCILRFYDENEDDVVDKNELRKLIKDSFAAVGETANENKVIDHMERVASVDGSKIREALNKNTITGSDRLFRGHRSFLRCGESADPIVYDAIDPTFDPRIGKHSNTEDQKCEKCMEMKYMVAPYKIQLTKKAKDGSGGRLVNPEVIDCPDNQDMDPEKKAMFARNVDANSPDRQILASMPECKWLTHPCSGEDIIKLCQRVLPFLRKDSALIEVCTPVYVFGAAHGSAAHLHQVSDIMFPCLPLFELGTFVFLGNFLSETAEGSGLQALLFLLAHKSLCPHRVFVLKGLAEVTKRNELLAQVKKVISNEPLRKRVCKQLCAVLDHLPLAVVINSDILCTSSGLPHSAERMADISDSDAADWLKNKIAEEILSLTPAKDSEIEPILSKLSVSHVIRSGKEVSENGYSFRLNGLVITLSASGGHKCFGMAFVDNNRIRMSSFSL